MNELIKREIKNALKPIIDKIDRGLSINEQCKKFIEWIEYLNASPVYNFDLTDTSILNYIKTFAKHQEDDSCIFDGKKYEPWLAAKKSEISWDFYERYEDYLFKIKNWNWQVIKSTSESTDIVLDRIGNPYTKKPFNIKGLVMGDIQSGKTANYTALINKSLDVGYKLVIVLAGMTKDLRSQTQQRLDLETLGFETQPNLHRGNIIGVGNVDSKCFVNSITNASPNGDFKTEVAKNAIQALNQNMVPLIAIVKKNKTVLENIETFLATSQGERTNGKLDIPVLIIDDEVDQASVDTSGSDKLDESSTINKLIRKILNSLNRSSYVGYTATPFANVFVNPHTDTEDEDLKDIFPEDFIVCLPTPKEYSGVKDFFGVTPLDDDDDLINLDLLSHVNDYYSFFSVDNKPCKITKNSVIINIPQSLKDAIIHFIVASAVKHSRNIIEHNSMLVHIHRCKSPATTLGEKVQNYVDDLYKEYRYGSHASKEVYKKYWLENMEMTSRKRLQENYCDEWDEIEKHLLLVLERTTRGVKVINGDSDDCCDYTSESFGEHIIIGGDKLSRGLTLNGLIVSYYYRNSSTYDTLLQMGRWFGYRIGWLDVCKIFTTKEFANSFILAGIATEEFKKDIAEMNSLKLTPKDFGLKIQYNPRLAPTANSKMRGSKKQKISFSNSLHQLLSFDKKYIEHNRQQVCSLVENLQSPIKRDSGNYVYKNVDSKTTLNFLSKYKECDTIPGSVSIKNWVKYIQNLNNFDELTNWTIVINSNIKESNGLTERINELDIFKSTRTDRRENVPFDEENIYLKVASNPGDFKEFFSPESNEYKTIKSFSPTDETIKKYFTAKTALLSVYLFDIQVKSNPSGGKNGVVKTYIENARNVVGLAIWFPETEHYSKSAVDFYVNEIFIKKQKEFNLNQFGVDEDEQS